MRQPNLARLPRTPDGLRVLPHVYTLMYQLHFCWRSEKGCFEKCNKKRDRVLNKKAEEKRASRPSRAQFKTHSEMVLLLYAASVKSGEERQKQYRILDFRNAFMLAEMGRLTSFSGLRDGSNATAG